MAAWLSGCAHLQMKRRFLSNIWNTCALSFPSFYISVLTLNRYFARGLFTLPGIALEVYLSNFSTYFVMLIAAFYFVLKSNDITR